MADSSTGAAGDGAGAAGDGAGAVSQSSTATVIEVSSFANYLRRVIPVLLEDAEDTPEALNVALKDRAAMECMKKFLSDPQIPVLLVQRSAAKDENEEGTEAEEKETVAYNITSEVKFFSLKVNSVVVIKRGLVVEADKNFSSQLRLMNLSDGSPYETLHAFVSNAVAPYFKSYVRATGKADRDGDKMAPSVEKKIEELEMGLLHLQQNIEIPEITLTVHPTVGAVIKKCEEEGRKPKVSDFGDRVEDATFLNNLQSGVNRWIREIQKVTKLDRDPSSGTALQEISFWLSLERALLRIQEKRENIEIALTLDILKHGKRFHATVSFDTDTGLKQALATVNDYNPLMKDFPLNDLLSATELERIRGALIAIFAHLKKIRATKYPIVRALRLVEAISRDLSTQLLKVLGTRRLMHIMFEDFEKVMVSCFEIFTAWDDEYDKLQSLLRDILKKKKEENLKMAWRVNHSHKRLQARLDQIRKFRRQHEQLRQVIIRVLRPAAITNVPASTTVAEAEQLKEPLALDAADANSVEEVNMAYDNVKEVDCLDVSKEGTDAWEAACKRYDERIDRVETRITARLRDQLGTAKNANEMFRIFSRFNALFVRPHIRGAIREYQTQLIQRVKDDIESLHEKFKIQYPQSKACHMSRDRDLPPVSGSIIWARQIERQLNAYMRRVEDVLGKGWENHVEGQKLKADGDSFRAKLNTQQLFEDWSARVHNKPLATGGRIFGIESARSRQAGKGNILRLKVNFTPEIITLAKEVRNLKWLGYRVPLAIVNKAHQANQYYPFAISLIESVRTYERTCDKVEDRQSIVLLVAGMRREVQSLITEGVVLTWDSYKLDQYVQKMAEAIFVFQEKVDDLLLVEEQIDLEVKALDTCAYSHNTMSEVLARIQKHVDDLSLHQYSNLLQWVSRLDQQVEARLATRLEAGLKAWRQALEQETREKDDQDMNNMDTDAPVQPTHKPGGEPKLKKFIHELRITNQVMYLSPPIEEARVNILSELYSWEAIIITLPRITHARYQVGVDAASVSETHYKNLLTKLPGGQDALHGAYEMIEKIVRDVDGYVRVWLDYQSLWDLQADYLYGKLGNSIPKWMKALEDIKSSRKTFDTSETSKDFGPIKIEFGKVQSKVSLKYDSWHKEVLGKFGNMLGTEMQEFHGQVSKSRGDLEQQSIETSNTSEAVGFITYVQSLKRKMKSWEKQVETYKEGQRILERQRFQFPTTWLYSDNVEGEWGAFSEIIRRKDASIQTQVASLQMKIVTEDKVVENKTTDLLSEWDKEKPVEGNMRPDEALKVLTIFEGKFTRLKDERDNISKAKEALELAEPGNLSASEERVSVGIEELQDLKGVWAELSKIWQQIDDMKEKPWLSVQPRKLRQTLDTLLGQLKDLPARLRSYPSYEHVKNAITSYTKVNMLVIELKSEAVKERHWKQLMKRLHVSWVLPDLTLGQLWDVDLQKNEVVIKDVLLVAQGEMALEEFLKQVSEVWRAYELELINYQNKCRLIRGWDDLFNKVKEHINSVAAMKLSPYYKEFEEDALSWEDKLNRINALFDVWIDVQRRWVYLEGIFTGSADIKHLLPVETSRFQSVSTEFLALMKKVTKSPLVMDVLNITNVQRQLERLADLLSKIQKALGEYLERERASFPRFYFVGDEDLLDIIGNSKNIPRLQKHFKKMFAGVHTIILDEEQTTVLGISSKEGEEVKYFNPVVVKDRKINEWLTMVEQEMRLTLARILAQAVQDFAEFHSKTIDQQKFLKWVDCYQAQLVVLAAQIAWSESAEKALQAIEQKGDRNIAPMANVLEVVEAMLNVLADSVLHEQPPVRRKKLENLITELVHQRDVIRELVKDQVASSRSFDWLRQMRFYFNPKLTDVLQQVSIHMANAKFNYGFEYLGVQEKLVQTPLTDRCYLAMTQALEARLGGSVSGPAGAGKTESVKALGNQLGRFVLVFNCDEMFDFQAMGRLLVGLCQFGAWGCFDEFNRLEERILSAVSQQVQTIQEALKELAKPKRKKKTTISVELVGKQVRVNPDMAIFITMNPDYAGRSNLPDNLKKLFRSLVMTTPDRQRISQVMLYSQGFRTAEKLAEKIVLFFKICDKQLSTQSHYDFGLRALKSVLVSAGNVKRSYIQRVKLGMTEFNEAAIAKQLPEQEILIKSIVETVVPKLVAEDILLLNSLLSDVFPGVAYVPAEMTRLNEEIVTICREMFLVHSDGEEHGGQWVEKILQLYRLIQIHHGLMMVGPSGSGKSTAWRVLLKALERIEGVEGMAYVIDPKSISKAALYGSFDPNTREWTDGLFTHILRKIIDNVRGEIGKRQWIVFDGDVDPEWVENLNSVLDDNKLLTLPNGERLAIPPNVRLIFEVQDLQYATLATVSRCGMVWFGEDILSLEMIFEGFLLKLKNIPLDGGEKESTHRLHTRAGGGGGAQEEGKKKDVSPSLMIQRDCAAVLLPYFVSNGLVCKCLEYGQQLEHIMDFMRLRALSTLFSMLSQAARNIISYNHSHTDFPMQHDQLVRYISLSLIYSLLWSIGGDCRLKVRQDLGNFIRGATTIPLPAGTNQPIIDFEVSIQGEWVPWSAKVSQVEIETHKVAAPDVIIPTVDTVRHEYLLSTWLFEHKPLVLCGPPGSGKTMTLLNALKALPDLKVVAVNFSSATTPELMLQTFDHYCEYRKTPNGLILSPIQPNKGLVLFCDEINLPDMDKYGTQRIISFLRQMVEHGGFYRTADQTWVKFERIQFVGACNPPTDPGRKPLNHRFLRHVPVLYVDYPGQTSLVHIYGTFNRAMLRLVPILHTYAEPLTNAMVELYLLSQTRFTQDMQPHYIYSPREMTRWVQGICEALRPLETLSTEGLVRIWAHEALRLFHDRLVDAEERAWANENIDRIALKHFPNINRDSALKRPILYSNWLSTDYVPVDQEELREHVKARLKVFYEEELDVPLVLFDEVLDHVLRIDRIFRQPQGHLLLIGVSGSGKTILSRFVAWLNGLSVFQVKVHNKYTAKDFDEDLRSVLRRSGCQGEKICFIMSASNVVDLSFLERMNTLLANGEVLGLFEGDKLTTLMNQCKGAAQHEGLVLDSQEEIYKWFTQQVMYNLHVVFTMNSSSESLKDKAAASPALFNRCVLNWFGDWSNNALYQVGKEFTNRIDLEKANYVSPGKAMTVGDLSLELTCHRDAVIATLVFVHQTLHQANNHVAKRGGRTMAITPRHYLDFINHYVKLFAEKWSDLEEQQLHLNIGLQKIRETVEQVEELQRSLSIKRNELEIKDNLADAKLKLMVKDQRETERRKQASQEIQLALEKQTLVISAKQASIKTDLAQVEPAVIDAQQAVKGIKKQNLAEVKSLPNPPPVVKLAIEGVMTLLGEKDLNWKSLRAVIMRENFMSAILNFNTENITDDIRKKMERYTSNPDYNFEKINSASVACGPLVKWTIAQIKYSEMLSHVEPLKIELNALEVEANENRRKNEEMQTLIANLEKSIGRYKEEYAVLISQAQAIKADLASVETKVGRSVALLKSLASEKTRWEAEIKSLKNQMSTIIGDVLLTSAFIAYAGYFDQHMRQNLFTTWCRHMQEVHIQFKPDIARIEYLSNADDRLKWQANSLPTDDLCTENAIMLSRFNRYPLIIDPSGQATEFILNYYKDKNITKTSFLEDSFRKNLENALRFGNALLVQDVESYDPILNPVLDRELRKTGGRVLITLGDQDIDFSPSFTIFLSTRDPTVEFAPNLCSRVSFVNFTVTRSSLQSQCLHQMLKAERPDVYAKRSDLLKLQGEFLLRRRQLEKALLTSLNEVKGRILDDDSIITYLETLKHEAEEIAKKVEESDATMAEVDSTSQQYIPLAQSCSSIYFTLESLYQVHFLYQFSLQFFLDIFSAILTDNKNLNGITNYTTRLATISKDLFQVSYNRVSCGMLHQDCITFAILLARIYLKLSPNESTYDVEFQHLMRGMEGLLTESLPKIDWLKPAQLQSVIGLERLASFKGLSRTLEKNKDVRRWLDDESDEFDVPVLWDERKPLSAIGITVYRMLVIQALRPDRMVAAARQFVCAVFGLSFMRADGQEPDLVNIIEHEVKANIPILMFSKPGYDARSRVEDLAASLNKPISVVAIGSAEGFSQAEKRINSASEIGHWVMLQNVHLAPWWLIQLEKKLHSLSLNRNFRIFLTMEINPKIPVNLLRAGRVLMFQPPPGVRANLLHTFSTLPSSRVCRMPSERSRLYFLLAWFHAVVQERLSYVPLGWSKRYEFNESDLRCACDTLDIWIDSVAMGRTNLPPEKVPWDAFRTLISQCIYGGKIDNEFDQRLMTAFVNKLFTAKSYKAEFTLVSGIDGQLNKRILMPDGIRHEDFVHFAEKLGERQTPSWLGLPNNAEKLLLRNLGSEMVNKLLKMDYDDDDDLAYAPMADSGKEEKEVDGRPAWMKTLSNSLNTWLQMLPKTLVALKHTIDNIKDPLFRFFEREVNAGIQLLADVRQDMSDASKICVGKKKPTNHHRVLIADLAKGTIPKSWHHYIIPSGITVFQWIADFSDRIKQLYAISQTSHQGGAADIKSLHLWLGGFFHPEDFLMATRQYAAQANSCSLEELYLQVLVCERKAVLDAGSFGVTGLKLQGAVCAKNTLQLSSSIHDLPLTSLKWVRFDTITPSLSRIKIPIYLNATRAKLLFTVDFEMDEGSGKDHSFYEQGVAIIANDIGS